MVRMGLPVPPGFVITTTACIEFFEHGSQLPNLKDQYLLALKDLEKSTGKTFGSPKNPLLLSVRSGAAVSMPGMMDTVLNLGINDQVVEGMAEMSGNRRWAFDCYRRFIQVSKSSLSFFAKTFFSC